jgi:hypothetical protein
MESVRRYPAAWKRVRNGNTYAILKTARKAESCDTFSKADSVGPAIVLMRGREDTQTLRQPDAQAFEKKISALIYHVVLSFTFGIYVKARALL